MKRILIGLLILLVCYVAVINVVDLYQEIFRPVPMLVMNASAMGSSVGLTIDESDSWITVIKSIALVLGIFLGIKIINKYIKK